MSLEMKRAVASQGESRVAADRNARAEHNVRRVDHVSLRNVDRTSVRSPRNAAVLEIAAPARRTIVLVAHRVSQIARFPPHTGPFGADGAMDLVSAGLRCPVNRATLKVIEPADAVGRTGFVSNGVTQKTTLPSQLGPFDSDVAMDLVGARLRCPVNGTPLKVIEPADAV